MYRHLPISAYTVMVVSLIVLITRFQKQAEPQTADEAVLAGVLLKAGS
jgi:hypothetical protein